LGHSSAIVAVENESVAHMARGTNPLKSVEIVYTVNSQTAWYLDRLIEKGVYGNTRQEAARIALFDYCKLLNAQGKLGEPPPIPSTEITIVPE
jgi:hypothetical protein